MITKDELNIMNIEVLKNALPKTFTKIKFSDKELKKCSKRYTERYFKQCNQFIGEKSSITKPHCIHDWIYMAEANDEQIKNNAKNFITFIDEQVSELVDKVDTCFRTKIVSAVKSMILSVDTNVELKNNPQYMNFLGEIVGLNYILSKGESSFELKGIEVPLENGKSVDFVFYDKKNDDYLYVDFVSIHHIELNKVEKPSDLRSFLEGRFNQKLDSKTTNLKEDLNRIILKDGKSVNFAIQPIIWSEIKDLLPFKSVFEEIDSLFANVFACMSLLPQRLENGDFVYQFSTVTNILSRWSEE